MLGQPGPRRCEGGLEGRVGEGGQRGRHLLERRLPGQVAGGDAHHPAPVGHAQQVLRRVTARRRGVQQRAPVPGSVGAQVVAVRRVRPQVVGQRRARAADCGQPGTQHLVSGSSPDQVGAALRVRDAGQPFQGHVGVGAAGSRVDQDVDLVGVPRQRAGVLDRRIDVTEAGAGQPRTAVALRGHAEARPTASWSTNAVTGGCHTARSSGSSAPMRSSAIGADGSV